MVGVIILYDHVHPVGAFAKSSNIDVSSNTFTSEYACINLFTVVFPMWAFFHLKPNKE